MDDTLIQAYAENERSIAVLLLAYTHLQVAKPAQSSEALMPCQNSDVTGV